MEFLNYLLKVSACSALFFAFYLLVLRRLTFFKINRFYLLSSLFLSFIIPSFQFEIKELVKNTATSVTSVSSHHVTAAIIAQNGKEATFLDKFFELITTYSPVCYGIVLMLILLTYCIKLFKLFQYTNNDVTSVNGLKLIKKSSGFTNCSFFNYVFIDEDKLTEDELEILLSHEKIHVTRYHSVDKIFLIIAKAMLWFNPIIYLLDKALDELHEFEADEATFDKCGLKNYASLLLKLAITPSTVAFTNSFAKSPLKNRITMLFNSKSKKMKKLTYLLALPMIVGMLWGFSTTVVYAQDLKEKMIELPMTKTDLKTKAPFNRKLVEVESVKKRELELVKEVVTSPSEKLKELEIDQSLYKRYEMLDKDGKPYDEVKISLVSKSSGTAFVPKNGKVIIIINGVKYSEDEIKEMDIAVTDGINSISVMETPKALKIFYPDLADKCNAVIQLPSLSQDELKKLNTKN